MTALILFLQLFLIGTIGSLLHFVCNYGKSIHCNLLDYAKGELAYTFASFGAITVAALGLMSAGVSIESPMVFPTMVGAGFMADNIFNRESNRNAVN